MKPGLGRLSGWVLAVACACGDAHEGPHTDAAAAEPQPDAATSSSQFDAVAYENSLAQKGPHPALPGRRLTPEEAEWAAAPEFEIGFEAGAGDCFGICPVYELTFASNGEVRFTGYQGTWKPGTYFFERSEADARTLYQNLILSGLLDLPQSCTDRENWHDVVGAGGGAPRVFILRARGREKKFVNLDDCGGKAPSYEQLHAMEREIVGAAAIEPYLKYEAWDCSGNIDGKTLFAGFVVRDAKAKSIGLLSMMLVERELSEMQVERKLGWTMTSCDGASIARGDLSVWGCDIGLIPSDELPFSWPGMSVKPSGAVLGGLRGGRTEFPLTLHTFDTEFQQRAVSGEACD